MAAIQSFGDDEATKRRILYAAMVALGVVFISTPVLPVSTGVAQLVAALVFGVMSGLWLGLLVWSL